MRLAIIPARGGSKRIPRKNVKHFCGKPTIAWSIEAARASNCFDRIIVSTDDEEIAEVSRGYGAEVPFIRPLELSDDYTGTTAVIAHAVKWIQQQGAMPTEVCCIYATAPFLRAEDLQRGLDMLRRHCCDYVFSATSYAFPIQRAIRITSTNRVEMFNPEYFNARSQDLESAFHDAAQFYWGRADAWLRGESIFSPNAAPVVLPRHCVLDIDTNEDWVFAEWMFRAMTQQSIT